MNWDAVGAIGQVVSGLALVFVIFQIRHARSESRRALSQGRGVAVRELMLGRLSNSKLSALYEKADVAFGGGTPPVLAMLMERTGMSIEEAASLNWDLFAWFHYRLQIIPNVDELPPVERTAFDSALRLTYGPPGVARAFYETYVRSTQHPDVVRYIESVLAQPPATFPHVASGSTLSPSTQEGTR